MASKTLELESLRKFIFSISCSFLRKVTTTIENRVQTVEPYTVIINEIRFLGILEKIYISNIILKKKWQQQQQTKYKYKPWSPTPLFFKKSDFLEFLRKLIFSISCFFSIKKVTTTKYRVQTMEPYTVIAQEIRFLGNPWKCFHSH
jgi:hypothetical protein